MRRAALAWVALAICAVSWGGEPASRNDQQVERALHESAMRAALGHPGVIVCRQLLVGIGERDWVRGEVVEVQGHLIGVRIEDSGRFPHILKGVPYTQGSVVWSDPSHWTPCL